MLYGKLPCTWVVTIFSLAPKRDGNMARPQLWEGEVEIETEIEEEIEEEIEAEMAVEVVADLQMLHAPGSRSTPCVEDLGALDERESSKKIQMAQQDGMAAGVTIVTLVRP